MVYEVTIRGEYTGEGYTKTDENSIQVGDDEPVYIGGADSGFAETIDDAVAAAALDKGRDFREQEKEGNATVLHDGRFTLVGLSIAQISNVGTTPIARHNDTTYVEPDYDTKLRIQDGFPQIASVHDYSTVHANANVPNHFDTRFHWSTSIQRRDFQHEGYVNLSFEISKAKDNKPSTEDVDSNREEQRLSGTVEELQNEYGSINVFRLPSHWNDGTLHTSYKLQTDSGTFTFDTARRATVKNMLDHYKNPERRARTDMDDRHIQRQESIFHNLVSAGFL